MTHGIKRTSLTPYAPYMQDPDPAGHRKRAAQQWRADGTIIIFPDSLKRLDRLDREYLEIIAAKIYGPRG